MIAAYFRGKSEEKLPLIELCASRKGKAADLILSDPFGEYGAFRELQHLVKREQVDTVIIPDVSALGDDEYTALENELFFRRNGVKLESAKRLPCDPRRETVSAIRRFYSFVPEWDVRYGLVLPQKRGARRDGAALPFGYRHENGEVFRDERESELVRLIFDSFIEGESIAGIRGLVKDEVSTKGMNFSRMTVRSILSNDHYLGRESGKGLALPPIITYGKWLMAKERMEREYAHELFRTPYFGRIFSDCGLRFFRGRRPDNYEGRLADSDALEELISGVIEKTASPENAKELIKCFAAPQAAKAARAFPIAAEEYNSCVRGMRKLLTAVKGGDFSEETQQKLEKEADRRVFLSMRLRRISSEAELFSVTEEEAQAFFERARRIRKLSREEQTFVSEAFIRRVLLFKDRTEVTVCSPSSGGYEKLRFDTIVK